jgi:hypothetical protein
MTMNFALLLGAGLGVAVYLLACWQFRKTPEIILCVESILLGAGVPSGGHLIYCAFEPKHLVHITHYDGKAADPAALQLTVNLGEWHTVEVFIGGFVGAFFCLIGLVSIYKKAASTTTPKVVPHTFST